MPTLSFPAVAVLALLASASACSAPIAPPPGSRSDAATSASTAPRLRSPDVIYVPTPREVVDAMLTGAGAGPGDVLYDLGSGDGRIPIAAVQRYNVSRAIGIEIDTDRVDEARANARVAELDGRVQFRNEDLFNADFSDATIVTLYLLPALNRKLLPRLLRDLRPGTRIVSHDFKMGDWQPERTLRVRGRSVHFWTVPEPGTLAHRAAWAAATASTRPN
jgi:SAM-dependent methyltransferase